MSRFTVRSYSINLTEGFFFVGSISRDNNANNTYIYLFVGDGYSYTGVATDPLLFAAIKYITRRLAIVYYLRVYFGCYDPRHIRIMWRVTFPRGARPRRIRCSFTAKMSRVRIYSARTLPARYSRNDVRGRRFRFPSKMLRLYPVRGLRRQ